MKILFVGGTGNISTSCSRLALQLGHELWLLHRPGRPEIPGARDLLCDIHDEASVNSVLAGHSFDAVVQFIAFKPAQIERDLRLFAGRCDQYVFISSASAYTKARNYAPITEQTLLENPRWQYSRDKIDCEAKLRSTAQAVGLRRDKQAERRSSWSVSKWMIFAGFVFIFLVSVELDGNSVTNQLLANVRGGS